MHFRGLDLNLLVSLDVLLRERSITRAGERLGLSQPATSGALSRLRDYFNDPLLVQVGRQLMLTPLAERLAGPVAEVLQQIQATVATKAVFDATKSERRFSVMASDYVCTVFMPDVLARVEQHAPKVTLQLRQLSPTWHDELSRGDVDFVIIPEPFAQQAHPRAPLFEDGFSCVTWSGNRSIGTTLTLDQYMSLGHVAVTLTGVHEPSFDEWFLKRGGHARRVEIIAPTYASVPSLVVGTQRLATIWSRLASDAVRHLPLRQLPLPIEIPALHEVLQWPAHRDTDPGCQWLKNVLVEAAAELPAAGATQGKRRR
jgi:LysR family nod box-dependent transcriptional activator